MGLGTTTNATEFLIWHFLKRQLQSCVCLLKSECCEIAEHLLFCGSGKLNETFLFQIRSWYEWSLSARGEGKLQRHAMVWWMWYLQLYSMVQGGMLSPPNTASLRGKTPRPAKSKPCLAPHKLTKPMGRSGQN